MPTFKNLDELNTYLKSAVNDVLATEVARVVIEEEQQNIDQTVYDPYSGNIDGKRRPSFYRRRVFDGGLISEDNIKAESPEDGVLEVTNITRRANPEEQYNGYFTSYPPDEPLADLIEYGDGYGGHNYDYDTKPDYLYRQPRPFTKNTIKSLESSGGHIKAMKEGLTARGLEIVE